MRIQLPITTRRFEHHSYKVLNQYMEIQFLRYHVQVNWVMKKYCGCLGIASFEPSVA